MSKIEIPKAPVVGRIKEGQTLKEHFTEIYKAVGQHFIEEAEVLAGDVNELTTSVKITIDLNPNEIVMIEKTTNQLVVGGENNE